MRSPLLSLPVTLAAALFSGVTTGCEVRDWPGADDLSDTAVERTPAGALEGTVLDEAGAPVAGAHVVAAPAGIEATTDAAGHWSIARLRPADYTITVAAPGYTTQTATAGPVAAGSTLQTEVTLVAATPTQGVVRAHVVGPDGAPVEGATVEATDGTTTATATTDSTGLAVVGGLGGLTVEVSAVDPSGRLTSYTAKSVPVPDTGGVDVAASLAGLPGASAVFTGSAACLSCHADESTDFAATAHANALTAVTGAPAEAFAAGETIDLGGATATLWSDAGQPTVTLTTASGVTDAWPVSGFIGGEARGAVPWAERDGRAWPLPIAWVAPDPEQVGFKDGGWIARDSTGWLDATGELAYTTAPDASLSAEAACFACHATGYTLDEAGGSVNMHGVTDTTARWDEAGVGCEACHGAGSEHVANPDNVSTITDPSHLDTGRANDVCGRCHGSRAGNAGTPFAWDDTHGVFKPGDVASDYGTTTYEGWANGAAKVAHAQVDEVQRSGHYTLGWESRCADCHSSHGGGYKADMRQSTEDNTLCLGCHTVLTFAGSADAAVAHAKHPLYLPDELVQEDRCVGCHMPSSAAQLDWNDRTGAGDLASHRFAIVPPSATLADFTTAGTDTLHAGQFQPNGCQECHAWNDWLFNGHFPGPTGDMTQRSTHELLDGAYTGMFP